MERCGIATLAASAVAHGTMHVHGTLVNYGTRGVQVHGSGTVEDRGGSTARDPDEKWDDGTAVYCG